MLIFLSSFFFFFIIKPVKVYIHGVAHSVHISRLSHSFLLKSGSNPRDPHPWETGQTSFNLHVSLCEGDMISVHYKTTVLLRAKKDMGSFSLEAPASKPAANQSHRCANQRSRWEKWNHMWIEQGSKASPTNSFWGSCYLFEGVCVYEQSQEKCQQISLNSNVSSAVAFQTPTAWCSMWNVNFY